MQNLLPPDGGPVYAETDLNLFISEPWNAISSLAIALPSVYWAIKLKWNFRDYGFLFFLMPLLFLGGIGSTLYHAFRSSRFLLWMDVLPTAIVTLSVGIYFWNKILPKKWQVATVIIPVTLLRFAIYQYIDGQFAINLSYFITGSLIFSPVLLYLFKNNWKYAFPIILSIFFLSISLVFRRIDFSVAEIIPIGSHFLWHIFSGFGAFYMAKYLFLIRRDELELINAQKYL
ncbi:MAG: hypothetical protein AAFY41_10960 [Bacteroidota bacterium]